MKRVRDLPLFWKVLLPFLILLVLLGTVGTYLLVSNLSGRANDTLNRDLTETSLAARVVVHDREVYVLESATLAANLQGVGDAVRAGNGSAVTALMQSVLALKTDLTLLAVVDGQGTGIAQFSRPAPGSAPVADVPASWAGHPLVGPSLGATDEAARAGLVGFGDRPMIALATTICSGAEACTPVGAIVAGVDAGRVIAEAGQDEGGGTALYDRRGRLVAASGHAPEGPPSPSGDRFVRHRTSIAGTKVAALYSPLELQGQRAGWLAVWTPTSGAFGGVGATALRFGLILFAAMIGVVAIGAGLSRFILAQVRPLVATNRALGSGDLSARAPVLGGDELGELAEGVNQMAAALQESHETLEARVHERTADVERLLRERTEFFTTVSHEFRTPLAIILGQAEMLADPAFEKKGAWHLQAGQVLSDAARQLLDFVNDILEIAKAESGHIDLDVGELRVETILRSLRSTVEQLAAAAGLSANVKVPRRLPIVRADEARVRQIILDLVDNSVKYTPAGGKVRVSAADVGNAVEISVADTGVGIPPEEADRLFEPFHRVKTTQPQRGQPSSGLGLALVKRLVEAQGGSVRFDSTPGRGTTFTVTLPLADADHQVA